MDETNSAQNPADVQQDVNASPAPQTEVSSAQPPSTNKSFRPRIWLIVGFVFILAVVAAGAFWLGRSGSVSTGQTQTATPSPVAEASPTVDLSPSPTPNSEKTPSPATEQLPSIPTVSTEGWKEVTLAGVSFKVPPDAICDQYKPSPSSSVCNLHLNSDDRIGQGMAVIPYLGGSRRQQYLQGRTSRDCKYVFSEAKFGNVKALQVAKNDTDCVGAQTTLTTLAVVGDRYITINWPGDEIGFDFDPNDILKPESTERSSITDTIVSTLRPADE